MSLFDSLVSKVWQVARQDDNFLPEFARLADDTKRVEKILALIEMEAVEVRDNFSGKCETRAEELRVQGNTNAALRSAPPSSAVLGRIYADRCQSLLQSNNPDLGLKDARRSLELPLSQQDIIRVHCLAASCHHQRGTHKLAEESLNEALNKLKSSDLQNDLKASMTGEIIQQLKKVKQKKQQQKPKKVQESGPVLPELTYGKNASIPAASAALRLCESDEKGRYMSANRDIKLGSVLIVEQPYSWTLTGEALSEHCLHCCAYVTAPVPCNQCTTVSFCSEECRDEAWSLYHRLECSILNHILHSTELSRMAWLVYRTVAKAMISRKDFYSLKPSFGTPIPFLSDDYATVWGQVTHSISRSPADLLKRTTSAIFLASLLHHVAPGETDTVAVSTVMLRHLQSCSCNAYQITEQVVPSGNVRISEEKELGGAVYPTISLCNHGCNPNVVRHSVGRFCVVRAVRNIRNGDEILDNYGPHFLSNSLEERQRLLSTQYFFTCVCEACSNNWPTVDRLNIAVVQYKCIQCSAIIGHFITGMRTCPYCKKKVDFNKIAKRLETLSRDYNKALEELLEMRLNQCLKTCVEYSNLMDSVIVHPNKQFVSVQQAITLSWSLMGNIKNV